MQHISSQRFNEIVTYFEKEHPTFTLSQLAEDFECSTERIRLIRRGTRVLYVPELMVLIDKYGVNEDYILRGNKPYVFPKGTGKLSEDPSLKYRQEIAQLKAEKAETERLLKEKTLLATLLTDKLESSNTKKRTAKKVN